MTGPAAAVRVTLPLGESEVAAGNAAQMMDCEDGCGVAPTFAMTPPEWPFDLTATYAVEPATGNGLAAAEPAFGELPDPTGWFIGRLFDARRSLLRAPEDRNNGAPSFTTGRRGRS